MEEQCSPAAVSTGAGARFLTNAPWAASSSLHIYLLEGTPGSQRNLSVLLLLTSVGHRPRHRDCAMPAFILVRLITLCIFSTSFVGFPVFISCPHPSVLLYWYILYLISHQVLHFYLDHWFSSPTVPFSFWILPFYMYWPASSWIPLFLPLLSWSIDSPRST